MPHAYSTWRTVSLDLTGALLWQLDSGLPSASGGSVPITHRGCLLAHSSAGLPAVASLRTVAPH